MDPSRLERFTDEFPGVPIPWYEELSPDESIDIVKKFVQNLPDDGVYIPGVDPEFFSLQRFLQLHDIVPQEVVFLNYFEGTVHRMRIADLARGFDA